MSNNKHPTKLLLRDGFFSTLLSLLVCYLLSFLFFNTSFFDPLKKALKDFSFLDVYYAERLDEEALVNTHIVLVNVERQSREELALALQQVLKSDPKVVGFDIILKEFEQTPADTVLKELLHSEKVVSTYIYDQEGSNITNHEFFKGDELLGFANFNSDSKSGIVREFNGVKAFEGETKYAFAAAIAKQYLSEEAWGRSQMESKIAKSRVINYQGNLDQFLHLTTDEVAQLEDDTLLKNKIVLFGYLGTPSGNQFDVEDKHFTPLNPITAGKSIPDMYGLVIHANILAMLIADNFMYKVPPFWVGVLLFLFSFIASVYFIWLDTRLKISYRTVRKAVVFVFSVLFVWITLLLFKKGIVLKSAPIIAVTVFSAGFIKYYKHLVAYINTKIEFESYYNKRKPPIIASEPEEEFLT